MNVDPENATATLLESRRLVDLLQLLNGDGEETRIVGGAVRNCLLGLPTGDIDLATEHPEFDVWQWVAPTRLPELIVPFKRQLYLDVLAEFQAHCVPAG